MEPLQRRCTDLFLEAAVERAGAHRCPGRDCRDVELLPEILFHPVQQWTKGCPAGYGRLVDDELCLPSGTFERHHAQTCRVGGDGRPVVLTHHVQTEVECGRSARRSQDVPVVDVENGSIDVDSRVPTRQLCGGRPVRRRAKSVEQAGVGERECADAQ